MEQTQWDEIFDFYARPITSPDGRFTFESSHKLINKLIALANFDKEDTVLDMGSGWGNLALEIAPLVKQVIAIEPSKKNIKAAQEKAISRKITNIHFIKGSFEKPNNQLRADKALSSLVFHQVPQSQRQKSVKNIYASLNPGGTFILCDPIILFDPIADQDTFNKVYRYLLPKTIPETVYKRYVEPYFLENLDYVFTWEDMKKYTPRNNQFVTLKELEILLQNAGFQLGDVQEFAPFFGIIEARKPLLR